jgi:hypothetical protein
LPIRGALNGSAGAGVSAGVEVSAGMKGSVGAGVLLGVGEEPAEQAARTIPKTKTTLSGARACCFFNISPHGFFLRDIVRQVYLWKSLSAEWGADPDLFGA